MGRESPVPRFSNSLGSLAQFEDCLAGPRVAPTPRGSHRSTRQRIGRIDCPCALSPGNAQVVRKLQQADRLRAANCPLKGLRVAAWLEVILVDTDDTSGLSSVSSGRRPTSDHPLLLCSGCVL